MSDLMGRPLYGPRSTICPRLLPLRGKGGIWVENAPSDKLARYVQPIEVSEAYIACVRGGVEELIRGERYQ